VSLSLQPPWSNLWPQAWPLGWHEFWDERRLDKDLCCAWKPYFHHLLPWKFKIEVLWFKIESSKPRRWSANVVRVALALLYKFHRREAHRHHPQPPCHHWNNLPWIQCGLCWMGSYTGPGSILQLCAFEFSGYVCLVHSVFALELGLLFLFFIFCIKKHEPKGSHS